MKRPCYFLLLLALFLGGCSKPTPPLGSQVDPSVRGEWTGERSYKNDFFKFSLNIPSDWELQKGDEESLKFIFQALEKAPESGRAAEAMRKQYVKIHVPLRALAHENPGSPERDPNILIMIENLEGRPSIKTGEDFLKEMDQTMKAAPVAPEFDGPATETTVNGVSCWTRSSTLKVNGGEGILWPGGYNVHQRGYAIVKGNYGLTILCAWTSLGKSPTMEKLISENLAVLK